MGLSALINKLLADGIEVSKKSNLRKYYNRYSEVVRIDFVPNKSLGYNSEANKQTTKIRELLKRELKPGDYQFRKEWYTISIFSASASKILNLLEPLILPRYVDKVLIETMPKDVVAETSIRPDLPKAHTVVVRKLPYDLYRYKIYWPATRNILREIGTQSLEAIAYQINADPNCKPIKDKTAKSLTSAGYQYGARYFYANNEDIFSIICLINPKFISRIEKFITIEEMNEKNIS